MSVECENCRHCIPDAKEKGRSQWIYARCAHPKTIEGKFRHFCATNRKPYGACSTGQLFEPKTPEITV